MQRFNDSTIQQIINRRVPRGEHGGETGDFFLAPTHGAGLLVLGRMRTTLSVPSRSTFFFSRRNARSTGSPFFNLISVNALTSFRGRVTTATGSSREN